MYVCMFVLLLYGIAIYVTNVSVLIMPHCSINRRPHASSPTNQTQVNEESLKNEVALKSQLDIIQVTYKWMTCTIS